MKHEFDDNHLDRLLFSLPLEEPPRDLRESILAATIYRPAFALKAWEIWMIGGLCAVLVWLCGLIVAGGGPAFMATLGVIGGGAWRGLATENAWLWLLLGVGATFWLGMLNINVAPIPSGMKKDFSRQ
ncbi:MAG: hypothetical protein DLM50_05550 [Candidatus Meridianibacter frigidus]|nr:MAG: hypothetical protein DLM50_05550 [Candidatus Eremiobacteraeota bacterium]